MLPDTKEKSDTTFHRKNTDSFAHPCLCIYSSSTRDCYNFPFLGEPLDQPLSYFRAPEVFKLPLQTLKLENNFVCKLVCQPYYTYGWRDMDQENGLHTGSSFSQLFHTTREK